MKDKTLPFLKAARAAFVVLLLAMAGLSQVKAQTVTVDRFNYTINEDGASVTVVGFADGVDDTGELVIPDAITLWGNTYPVTAIGGNAFYERGGITSVFTGNSVTYIGGYAFAWSGVTSLNISNSVTTIEYDAFCGTNLTTVTIPSSVTSMGWYVFGYCQSLTSLYYNATNCGGLDGWFMDCNSLTNLTIGDNVQVIPNGFVSGRNSLVGELVIPASVTTIGDNAFNGCSGFTGVLNIPSNVTGIGNHAFDGCSGFSGSLTIPNNVTTIGEQAFVNCSGLSGTLTLGSSLTEIGPSAFFGACENFTAMNVLAENPPTLGTNAFISANYSIPVTVPSCSVSDYQNASGWDVFGNYQAGSADACFHAITATVEPSEGGTVEGVGSYMKGETCTLTAIPNEGYAFVNWTESQHFSDWWGEWDEDVEVSTDMEYSFEVVGDWELKANFRVKDSYMINAWAEPSEGGAVEGAGSYFEGETCTLTAIPNTDYAFVNWTENGVEVSADLEYAFEVWDYRDIVANFRYIRHEITAQVVPGQGGIVEGAGSFLEGETCTLTATPTGSYYFVNWTENGEEVSIDAEYTFTVTEDRSLQAHFALPTHSIVATVNPSEAGVVEFSCAAPYEAQVGELGSTNNSQFPLLLLYNYSIGENLFHADELVAAGMTTAPMASISWNAASVQYYEENNITIWMANVSDEALTSNSHITAGMTKVFSGNITPVVGWNEFVFNEGDFAWDGVSNLLVCVQRNNGAWHSNMNWKCVSTDFVSQLYQRNDNNAYDMENQSYPANGTEQKRAVALFKSKDSGAVASNSVDYPIGMTCVVTAVPNPGYAFVNWQENGAVVSTDAEYSFTVLEDRNLVAQFTPEYEVVASVNDEAGGIVEGEGTYLEGASCTLTAIPNEEWVFVNWTEDDVEVSADAEYTFTVTGNRYLMANFRNIRHDIAVSVIPLAGGVVDANGMEVEEVLASQTFDFENGMQGWTTIDADGDGRTWMINSQWNTSVLGHNGSSDFVMSESYNNNYGALYPDNYLVSPQIELGGSITFFACTQDTDWALEHFGVAVSTTGTNVSDFVTIQEWTMSAKGVGAPTGGTRSGNRGGQGTWYQYTVDLSNYAGTGYVAIRHFNCSDMWHLNVDDITIASPGSYVSYLEGETCTLTATPNEGWAFYNWWENGEIVSTNPEYSFTIETDRTLLVRFKNPNTIDFVDSKVEAICVSHWDTDGDGFISYVEAAAVTDLGNAFRDNTEITSFDELQFFTGLPGISNYAFYGCSSLVSVTFPEGITSIGEGAFQNCSSLAGALIIPNSVESIGDYAYRECSSLTSLTIGNSVTYIGHNAFYHCYGLSGELTIPNSVETIGIGVFIECGFTGTLTLGSGLTSIGNAAFRRLNVSEVHWNAVNCTFAGDNWDAPIFVECNNLSTLVFADDVVTIPEYAFLFCSNLTGELILPGSLTYIGGGAFYGCSSFTGSLVIPDSVEYIGWESFSNTGFDGTLTIGPSVEEVGEYAFSNTGFTTLNYNATNCQFGYYYNGGDWYEYTPAITDCPLLTTLNIGDGVESISTLAFKDLANFSGTLVLPNSLKYISDQAFYNCYGFDGIVMGNSVETIGNEAFRNCGGFRGELTLPETLQSVGTYAFAGCDEINTINYNAINCSEMGNAQQPVFSDCASIEHINIGSAVESMPNYAFKRCTNVADMHTAAVVPPVIQASTFAAVPRSIPVLVPSGSGDAYRSAQYWEEFFNIMEDGEQYSFYWDVDAHQYAHNLSVIGLVQINGEEQSSPALEIGAFCGDECRGRQLLTAYPDLNRSLVFLTVFGEEGDLITFRLYDHEAEEESTLACATVLTFEADAIIGSYNEPEVLNFVEMQNTALEAGWTWFSTYIDADGAELLQMMEESLGASGVMIKSLTDGFVSNDEYGWEGTLMSVNAESMYMVNTSAPAVVSLSGPFANAAEHPVTLSPEWNWIGYPAAKASSLNNALAGFNAMDGDVIKMQESFSQYVEGIGWTGALKTLVPSQGLMYHSLNGSETTLTYAVGAKDGAVEENLTSEGNHWTPNVKAFPFNMSVVAVVEIDGAEVSDDRYELAVFADGECRGSVRLMQVEALDRYMAFLTVSGNGNADLEWALYDNETGLEYRGSETKLQFEQNAVVGSVKEPLIVRFADLTGTDETMNKVSCYPNPVRRSQYVRVNLPAGSGEARVDMVNALGATVLSQRVNGLNAEVKAPAAAGVYVVRVTIDGKAVAYTKLIVE